MMLFIDGTWLYKNHHKLIESYGSDFQLDYGKLPVVLAEEVGKQLGHTEIDVVRTYLFGSYPANYDLQDESLAQSQLDFFSMLKEEYHYEVEIFPINFAGRRIRRKDRAPDDKFHPEEKCVDVSLATYMLYFAAIPYAYDIAIAITGDRDFKPVLQHVRRLGKRVAIASIKGSCAPELADSRDEARVKDFDIIWLNQLLNKLELKYERHQRECESPVHKGDRRVWTTFRPRKGVKFYCDECRAEFSRQKREAQQEFVSSEAEELQEDNSAKASDSATPLHGVVKSKKDENGYGFIRAENGHDYFFHFTDLEPELTFEDVHEGLRVSFKVKREPSPNGKAGAAQNVRKEENED